jgi:hypothetical protein
VRCVRKGHRNHLHEHVQDDMVVVSDRCIRCGRETLRSIRAANPVGVGAARPAAPRGGPPQPKDANAAERRP